jgi:hypothetical protein
MSGAVRIDLDLRQPLWYVGPRNWQGRPRLRPGDVVGVTGVINTRTHQLVAGGPVRVYRVATSPTG